MLGIKVTLQPENLRDGTHMGNDPGCEQREDVWDL